jgi:hypothetical protein
VDKIIENVSKPIFTKVSRRKFIKLMALGGGALAAGGTSMSLMSCSKSQTLVEPDDIPVRNPAFRAIPGDLEDHTVLYCQIGTGEYLAYDLNSTGYQIWQQCMDHSEYLEEYSKTVLEIASAVEQSCDIQIVQDFITKMYASGLAYSGKSANQAYFVYQERL